MSEEKSRPKSKRDVSFYSLEFSPVPFYDFSADIENFNSKNNILKTAVF
jgi:hypothetical protein